MYYVLLSWRQSERTRGSWVELILYSKNTGIYTSLILHLTNHGHRSKPSFAECAIRTIILVLVRHALRRGSDATRLRTVPELLLLLGLDLRRYILSHLGWAGQLLRRHRAGMRYVQLHRHGCLRRSVPAQQESQLADGIRASSALQPVAYVLRPS